jgi:hypothetical protein
MEKITRNEILTTPNVDNFFYNSLIKMKKIFELKNSVFDDIFTHRDRTKLVKSIKSILRNVNRNKYVSKKDMKVVMDFADLFNRTMLHSKLVTRNLEQISQQELDDIYDRDRKIIFDVFLYLSAKLKPQISTYQIINEPAVSNSTVSIHV